MSNIINKIDHGINFEYDALDGLSMPTKLITVNNSDYKLINSKDIDWNNSFLSYIPQIQNISDYIKQQYINDDVKDDKKPYWKNKGQVNSSQELLDIINYLISRVIYADQKIQEFIDKENLIRITLKFEGDDVEVDNNQNPKPFEFYLVPNEYDSRTKNFDVKTHPKIDDSVHLILGISLSSPNDGSLNPSQILNTETTKVLSGSETEEVSSYFKVKLIASGFNRKYNEVELRITFTTNRTEKFDKIDTIETYITIHKDDNPIEYLVINNEVYKVYKPEKFANLFGENFKFYGAISEKELEILEKDDNDEYIFKEGTFTDPTSHSLAWFIVQGKFHFFCSDEEDIYYNGEKINNVRINIPRDKDTTIEIYTKYDKTNCLDEKDKSDTDSIDCYFILNKLVEQSSLKIKTNSPGTAKFNNNLVCNQTRWYCERSINGKNRKGFCITLIEPSYKYDDSKFDMNLYLSGTKYIKHYSEICLPFNITPVNDLELFLNEYNGAVWNEINNPNNIDDDNKLSYSLKGDINTSYVFNIGVPLFTHKSFIIAGKDKLNDVFEEGNKMSIPIYSYFDNRGRNGLIDVKIHGSETSVTNEIEIDYASTWSEVEKVCPDMCKYDNLLNANMTDEKKGEELLNKFIKFKKELRRNTNEYEFIYFELNRATSYPHEINYRVFSRENDDTAKALPIICKIPGHTSGDGKLYNELKFTLNLTIYRGSSKLIALNYAANNGIRRSIYAELLKPIKFSYLYQQSTSFGDFEDVSSENCHYITSRSDTKLIFNADDDELYNNKWFKISDIDASVKEDNSKIKDSIETTQITFIRNNYGLDKNSKNFEYKEYFVGDINDDKNVDSEDSELLKDKIKSGNFTPKESIICDINGDGKVDDADVTELDKFKYDYERRIYTDDCDITHSLPVENAKYINSTINLSEVDKFELLANDQYYGAKVDLSFNIKKINDDYNILSDVFKEEDIMELGSKFTINPGYSASCILHPGKYEYNNDNKVCTISISSLFTTYTSSTNTIVDKIIIKGDNRNFELFGKIISTKDENDKYVVSNNTENLSEIIENMSDDKIIFDYQNDEIRIETNGLWDNWKDDAPKNYEGNVVVKLVGWKYPNEIYNGTVFHMTIILTP